MIFDTILITTTTTTLLLNIQGSLLLFGIGNSVVNEEGYRATIETCSG